MWEQICNACVKGLVCCSCLCPHLWVSIQLSFAAYGSHFLDALCEPLNILPFFVDAGHLNLLVLNAKFCVCFPEHLACSQGS